MARRPKKDPVADAIIHGSWLIPAVLALGLFVMCYGVIPAITNPILKGLALGFSPLVKLAMWVFVVIAMFKLIGEQLKKTRPKAFQPFPPPAHTPLHNTAHEISSVTESDEIVPSKLASWSLQLLKDIEWKKFEELSTAYYQEKGIRAEATSLGADGGIDIKLYQDDSGSPTAIVQCKAWNARMVGIKQMREFLGVLVHEKIAKGFYMTSGDFSEDAKMFAKTNRVTMITGEMLLMMIQRLPADSQAKLLALATEGDYKTPSCPSHGVKMVKRTSKRGDFYGCPNYPRCRQTLYANAKP